MKKIRVLLADDHRLFRVGLKSILERQPGIEVIGEAVDGLSALKLAEQLSPDVILLDISMPGLNGVDTLRRLKELGSNARVVILSMHSGRDYVAEAIKAGARGYLLKDSALDELVAGIRAVAAGEIFLPSRIARILVDDYIAVSEVGKTNAAIALTTREREVVQLLAEGNSTKETAAKLNISAKTVETHRKRLMDKLGISSVAELTRYAIREKMISLE